jgi:hypothetical protein
MFLGLLLLKCHFCQYHAISNTTRCVPTNYKLSNTHLVASANLGFFWDVILLLNTNRHILQRGCL